MKYVLIIIALIVMNYLAVRAFDSGMDNKDRMLCNSAKVSGNVEYLKKCTCFYAGEDIRCIYEGNK